MTNARKEIKIPVNPFRYFYDTVLVVLILAIFLLIASVVLILYQIYYRPLPVFYAISPEKKAIRLSPFREPNYLPTTLIKWARKAAVLAYTFDFVNYNKQFEAIRPFFTPDGWASYQASVANLIGTIRANQLFVNGVVSGQPVIANQGDLPGKGYTWRIQLPFAVTYQSAESSSRKKFVVILTVVKVSTSIDPAGIGIDQFIMK